MTLILTHSSAAGVLQVSDRLLNQNGQPFDALSNKSVLFLAKNGLIALGYTGRAYIDSTPTDRWIARKLARDDTLQDDGFGALQTGFELPQSWMQVREAILYLGHELMKAFTRPKNLLGLKFLAIDIQGWQWPTKGWRWELRRARPVRYLLHNDPVPGVFAIETTPRYWGWETGHFAFTATPSGWLKSEMNADSMQRLQNAVSLEEIEEILVETVREVSKKHPGMVGPHCLSITLPRPSISQLVKSSYLPELSTGTPAELVPGYTPWVIAPDTVLSPTVVNGPGELEVPSGPFNFQFSGGTQLEVQPDGSIIIWQSQPRPTDPLS